MKYFYYLLIFVLFWTQNGFSKNRYDIKNKRTGKIGFSYVADKEISYQPEWGNLAFKKMQDQMSEYEKSVAIDCEEIQVGVTPAPLPSPEPSTSPSPMPSPSMIPIMKTQCTIPQSYEVIVTDLTSDEQVETQRKSNITVLALRLKVLAAQDDLTAAELKEAIIKTLKLFVLKKEID